MIQDLEQIGYRRGFIADMKAGIESDKDVNKFASAARGYIDLLTGHIDKENNVLFPMAEGRIDEAEDARLMAAFEKLERERIGPGRHKEFHGLPSITRRDCITRSARAVHTPTERKVMAGKPKNTATDRLVCE